MPGTKIAEAVRREQIIAAAYAIAAKHGLNAVTIRVVALRADTSPGLVIFHFKTKDELILAVLDWVLSTTTAVAVGPEITAIQDPLERLIGLLRQEMARLSREPQAIRVFFEFWSAGIWDRKIGARMQSELDRYRDAFRSMAGAVIAAEPERFKGVTAAALTTFAVSLIKGYAVQSMIEPELDTGAFMRAAERLLSPPIPAKPKLKVHHANH
jgi:AcrR family transcriptional regulator